jgi:hypothetical protein
MSLSSLLKKGSLRRFATATPATVATDKSSIPSSVATVATVNVATTQKPASNDLEPAPNRVTVGRDLIPQQGNEVSIALELDPDPDRHCWPHSAAMTGTEIGIFTARLAHFTGKGIPLGFAESVADKLVLRDRTKTIGVLAWNAPTCQVVGLDRGNAGTGSVQLWPGVRGMRSCQTNWFSCSNDVMDSMEHEAGAFTAPGPHAQVQRAQA